MYKQITFLSLTKELETGKLPVLAAFLTHPSGSVSTVLLTLSWKQNRMEMVTKVGNVKHL